MQRFWDLFSCDYRENCLSWIHYKDNPVISRCGETWKKYWTANPDILEFKGSILLYYRGNGILPEKLERHDRIAVAQINDIDSLDITFLNNDMPIFELEDVGYDDAFALDPAAAVFNDKVFLYYSAIDVNGKETIGLAVSENGIDFEKIGPVLMGRAPEVVVWNNKLWLFYQYYEMTNNSPAFQLACFVSDDGISFSEKIDIDFKREPNTWDSFSIATCRIEKGDDDIFYMIYGASPDHTDEPDGFGLARSKDLIHWEKHPGNPVFGIGAKGSADGGAVWFPALYEKNNVFYMLYEGSRGRYSWDLSSEICMSYIKSK